MRLKKILTFIIKEIQVVTTLIDKGKLLFCTFYDLNKKINYLLIYLVIYKLGIWSLGIECVTSINKGTIIMSSQDKEQIETNETLAKEVNSKYDSESKPRSKKSPAEAFLDLKAVVNIMRAEVHEVRDYSSALIELSKEEKENLREEGRENGINALFRIHQLLFRQIANMKSGHVDNDPFVRNIFENVEAELKSFGVQLIEPKIGQIADYGFMTAVNSIKSNWHKKPNTIYRVESYGIFIENEEFVKIIKKAEITVYSNSRR